MKYVYLAIAMIVVGGVLASLALRWLGGTITFWLGVLLAIAVPVLFYFNKSDSVADTVIEHIADATPPLISATLVLGWWLGYGVWRVTRRLG